MVDNESYYKNNTAFINTVTVKLYWAYKDSGMN